MPAYVKTVWTTGDVITQAKARNFEDGIEANQVHVGVIVPCPGASASPGYLLCDGAAVSRTTYAQLFAVWGTTFGVGDGSTTFNVPNVQGRFLLGKAAAGTGSTLGGTGGAIDHTHGAGSFAGGAHSHIVGDHSHGAGTLAGPSHAHGISLDTGYEKDVSSVTEMAAGSNNNMADHRHDVTGSTAAAGTGAVTGTTAGSGALGTSSDAAGTVTGTSGTNNPPFLAVNYMIRY